MRTSAVLAIVLVLVMPAPPVAAQRGAGAAVEVSLRVHEGRMYVPVEAADGMMLDFVLSTGSTVTVLAESTMRRLGARKELTLAGLNVPVDGSQTVPDASLTMGGKSFAGMISSNMLNRFDILIDAPRGRLTLKPAGSAVSWDGVKLSDPVRLRVFHGVVLGLDVELNGTVYPGMLELGTQGLLVNERVIAEQGITDGRVGMRLGDATYHDVPVAVSDHPVMQRFSPNGDGFVLVGAPVALDCVVSVSWVHAELRTCVR